MKYTKRLIVLLLVKIFIGAVVFLLLQRVFSPEEPLLNAGIYSAFLGLSIYFIGETILKIYQQNKRPNAGE